MGVFGEVSKVVPLWSSLRETPGLTMLLCFCSWESGKLSEHMALMGRPFEELYKNPRGVVMKPKVD
jgi:hypothetical protein